MTKRNNMGHLSATLAIFQADLLSRKVLYNLLELS